MRQIITTAQAKEIDRYSIEELGMPSLVLMERAALAFVSHVKESITKDTTVLAVCGAGNNGGDGMAAARILYEEGYSCSVYFCGHEEQMTQSTRTQWELIHNLGIVVEQEFAPAEHTVLIDAVFGIGLSREVTGEYAQLIQQMNEFRCFSVDLPSGMNVDTGCAWGVCVHAQMTVTFGEIKAGLLLGEGREYAGKVYAENIGFPKDAVEHSIQQHIPFFYLEHDDIKKMLPVRPANANKGTCGRLLLVAGSEQMIGAAYFAGTAAYRAGVGLVQIVTNRRAIPALATLLPAAIYTPADELLFSDAMEFIQGENKAKEGEKKIEHIIAHITEVLQKADCVALGPGIGASRQAECLTGIFLDLCARLKKTLILDADGLNLLAKHPDWFIMLGEHVIMTPHLKEMGRLTGMGIQDLYQDLAGNAVSFAEKWDNTTIVLKDSRSVITNGRELYINVSGNDGMAVGGSGDVLTGILGGLLSSEKSSDAGRELSMVQMAALGAYLHGLSGDRAVEGMSHYSLMPQDILDGISKVFDS